MALVVIIILTTTSTALRYLSVGIARHFINAVLDATANKILFKLLLFLD